MCLITTFISHCGCPNTPCTGGLPYIAITSALNFFIRLSLGSLKTDLWVLNSLIFCAQFFASAFDHFHDFLFFHKLSKKVGQYPKLSEEKVAIQVFISVQYKYIMSLFFWEKETFLDDQYRMAPNNTLLCLCTSLQIT